MAAAKLAMDAAGTVRGSTLVTVMSRKRGGIRAAGQRDGHGVVHCTRRAGEWPVLPRIRTRGCQSRPRRLGDHGDARPRRVRDGRGACHHALRRRNERRRPRDDPRDGEDHDRTPPRLPASVARIIGIPSGIDVRKVVETGVLPVINTGIAHREAGVGQIGAGTGRHRRRCSPRPFTGWSAHATNRHDPHRPHRHRRECARS